MILEMKVPSPESIKEVEIATWLVRRRLRRKDQGLLRLMSDKAT
jgi:pyruvate/2-oxoglutarate dehydrogenase complex dihydrolipoamide acyltransferase (E2) component